MHADEFEITKGLVERLIDEQFPEWSDLEVSHLNVMGSDNVIFKLGDDKVIRLPRLESSSEFAERENIWLPKISKHVSIKTSQPVASGKPTSFYPFYWSVCYWIDGETSFEAKSINYNNLARDLASFIKELRNIKLSGAEPLSKRGKSLEVQVKDVEVALSDLKEEIDVKLASEIWQDCLNTEEYSGEPVWMHGDLLPSNILVKNGHLEAVIDFGLFGVGDPSCDLLPAWCLFDKESRNIFLEELKLDKASIMRGKGWALSVAIKILPYFRNTNRELVEVANKMLTNILSD
ncbi:MAG: aminoglycoside phosphotransferase family protein [Rickettsiales bacterium]